MSSRNAWPGWMVFRYQMEFARVSSTRGSSPRSRSITPRYPALTSAIGTPSSWSAASIESRVAPAAPFTVIPSAIAMLTGETKRLSSAGCWRASAPKNAKAKALSAATSRRSPAVRSRGRCVIGPRPGSRPHAAAAATATMRNERVVMRTMVAPGRVPRYCTRTVAAPVRPPLVARMTAVPVRRPRMLAVTPFRL